MNNVECSKNENLVVLVKLFELIDVNIYILFDLFVVKNNDLIESESINKIIKEWE